MMTKAQQTRMWQQFCEGCSQMALLDDKMRQQIILQLIAADENKLSVKELTEKLPISQPAVSHHLKILAAAKLVKFKKVGLRNYYYLTLDSQLKRFVKHIQRVQENMLG